MCIARSARLVRFGQEMFKLVVSSTDEAQRRLDKFGEVCSSAALVIDGNSVAICLEHLRDQFIELVADTKVVVACRMSPDQKAIIVRLMKAKANGQVCACIGDGANDVPMIQEANVGIGIFGKEGMQAALAADFAIQEFSYLPRLFLWHGRNCYKRTAKLSQFILHRGLVISFVQMVFMSMFYFAPVSCFDSYMVVLYSILYTVLPTLSLILDFDIPWGTAYLYPELYKDLQFGSSCNWRTFTNWMLKSVWQGGIIMILALALYKKNLLNIVAIAYTSLVLTELTNVLIEVNHYNRFVLGSVLFSFVTYVATIFLLPSVFNRGFVTSLLLWKNAFIIQVVTVVPVLLGKWYTSIMTPSDNSKVKDSSRSIYMIEEEVFL